MWDEQGEHQQICQSGQEKATKISKLNKKYRKMWELETREVAFSKEDMLIVYQLPNDHPWKH